jgi:hypothetical protein
MDAILSERLNNLSAQNKALEGVEGRYLLKEAGRKTMESDIYLSSAGGNVAERQAKVHTNPEYRTYMKDLAELQSRFNFEKRKYDILSNAFYSELACYKREMGIIQKGGG